MEKLWEEHFRQNGKPYIPQILEEWEEPDVIQGPPSKRFILTRERHSLKVQEHTLTELLNHSIENHGGLKQVKQFAFLFDENKKRQKEVEAELNALPVPKRNQ